MNFTRAAVLVVVVGSLAAWLAAAATLDRRDAPQPTVVAPAPIDVSGIELTREIERLHDRLRPDVAPHRGRDLFRFAAAPRAAASALAAPPAPNPAAVVPAASQPALKLIGIAEDTTPDGVVRTAIISGPNQLFLVKEGESVTPRYLVSAISPDVVELTDQSDNSARRLALK